jgi:ribosome-associated translation inhibitor RaiA
VSVELVEDFDASVKVPVTMTFVRRGNVTSGAVTYARRRIGALLARVAEPILSARVKLAMAPDPALERPAIAQATIDIDGDVVRAQIRGHDMREAIDLLQARLRNRLEHRSHRRHAVRHRPTTVVPGQWRRGDASTDPDYFDGSPAERMVVRHKSYVGDELTPDEAAFDMDQLDFNIYLSRDLTSGGDAVLERVSAGSYRLTRVGASATDTVPTAADVEIAEHPAPELLLDEASEQLSAGGGRFVIFENAATGRGSVLYRRYDGNYGLITLE